MKTSLLLAMWGMFGGAKLRTETFLANQTWVCPVGVTNLVSVIGKGQNGTNSSTAPTSYATVIVVYGGTGKANFGNHGWDGLSILVDAAADALNAGSSGTFTTRVVYQGTDNSYDLLTGSLPFSGASGPVTKSYGGGWATSGNIAASGDGNVSWTQTIPAAAGADSTGFGKTFAGGAPSTAAVPVSYFSIPVTPGNSYPIVVPSGGSITITYL